MNIWRLDEISPAKREILMRRAEVDISGHMALAAEIAEDVRLNGDSAVLAYTERFDKVLPAGGIRVCESEIEKGYDSLSKNVRDAICYAAGNIKKFHEKQMPQEMWFTDIDEGLMAGEKTTPIEDVCLYVPRGKGSFPSVLLMLGIPARVAGVRRIVVITPPNEEGGCDAALLAAAKVSGIYEIYKVGGIQGVAAVAYGTQTVPKCRKIVGPGNSYVTAAKRVLSGVIDPGPHAGPSEAIILCDEKADPKKAALDWMIEAEHGPDSAALLVTHSEELILAAMDIVKAQIKKLSKKRGEFISTNLSTYGGAVLTGSLDESIDFVNEYAPEHMEVLTQRPFDILPKIKNAGEILLGDYTPITLCNFLLGPNAILPTGGHARTVSSVSVFDFLKRSSIGFATKQGFERVRSLAADFAMAEGFEAHARAVLDRE